MLKSSPLFIPFRNVNPARARSKIISHFDAPIYPLTDKKRCELKLVYVDKALVSEL